MTLDQAYKVWLNEMPAMRYGSMHRATFEAGWNAAIEASMNHVRHDCECGMPCDCYSPTTAKYQIKELKK